MVPDLSEGWTRETATVEKRAKASFPPLASGHLAIASEKTGWLILTQFYCLHLSKSHLEIASEEKTFDTYSSRYILVKRQNFPGQSFNFPPPGSGQ